jgi:hypothetical protein
MLLHLHVCSLSVLEIMDDIDLPAGLPYLLPPISEISMFGIALIISRSLRLSVYIIARLFFFCLQ